VRHFKVPKDQSSWDT